MSKQTVHDGSGKERSNLKRKIRKNSQEIQDEAEAGPSRAEQPSPSKFAQGKRMRKVNNKQFTPSNIVTRSRSNVIYDDYSQVLNLPQISFEHIRGKGDSLNSNVSSTQSSSGSNNNNAVINEVTLVKIPQMELLLTKETSGPQFSVTSKTTNDTLSLIQEDLGELPQEGSQDDFEGDHVDVIATDNGEFQLEDEGELDEQSGVSSDSDSEQSQEETEESQGKLCSPGSVRSDFSQVDSVVAFNRKSINKNFLDEEEKSEDELTEKDLEALRGNPAFEKYLKKVAGEFKVKEKKREPKSKVAKVARVAKRQSHVSSRNVDSPRFVDTSWTIKNKVSI